MAEAATAGAMPLLPGIPDEIVIWEVLVRLPPICLLRCRAVARSWRRITFAHDFLLAHHGRQPSLPIFSGFSGRYHNILTFDHQAADPHLQPVARLDNDQSLYVETSCDGLLILSTGSKNGDHFYVCNPATRQHARLWGPPDFRLFTLLGMYPHRPTNEYRVLMYRRSNDESIVENLLANDRVGFYIFTLGSDRPRYIEGLEPEAAEDLLWDTPALVRGSLHWSPRKHQTESSLIWVFDTTAESFRHIRAPCDPTESYCFEIDGTLGIYRLNDAMQIIDIWVLQNYEGQVWEYKYRIQLPEEEIKGLLGWRKYELQVTVLSSDGDVLLLLAHGQWLFYVDTDGKLVDNFLHDGQLLNAFQFSLKQTLVPHNFFTALESYAVNASPFI
ncbi:hypothetical protein QYE76_013575 [Lolium multiflorum]|uniref:F-box associated beta-propeller type 3 domain-containing protein n=1 Tax=Lolium multiflorum TaxID=4521 RepID=A0AAD8U2W3_LOLMU|nr:F-box protein At5g65850-like [Lolium perenne]KAK1696878.1 hypothetical protein QYE76_013575 [Lolium multiflorum]